MSESLTLYDLKREVSDKAEWAYSPFTWCIRLVLNVKKIPYRTEWLDYIEIAPKMRELGLQENNAYPIKYKVIAQYLEDQYPDRVVLFPPGTRALQAAFLASSARSIISPIIAVCAYFIDTTLAEHDRKHFVDTRKAIFGGTIEELFPKGDALVVAVKGFEKALEDLAMWLDASADGTTFFGGSNLVYVDIAVVSYLIYIIKVIPESHPVRVALKNAQDGRWIRYLDTFAEWTKNADQ